MKEYLQFDRVSEKKTKIHTIDYVQGYTLAYTQGCPRGVSRNLLREGF